MNSIQKTARITGLLILIMAAIAAFSMAYVPTTLIVPGDAATTAQQIMAAEGLFRLGMVGDMAIFLIEIALCALLYVLLNPVSPTISLIAAFARLAMTIIQGINVLNYLAVLLLLGGTSYLTSFAPDQQQALAALLLNAHDSAVLIWGVAFALHLLLSGYLVYRSGYLPRLVGGLLIIVGQLSLGELMAFQFLMGLIQAPLQQLTLLTSQLQTQLAGALELEREAAMACFADPDTAKRIAGFAAGRP